MISFQKNAHFLLWLVIPVLTGIAYPFLKTNPQYLDWLTTGIFIYVLFFSVVLHELCHGIAARYCGDSTASDAGRLTLNPIHHISVIGSIIVPLGLYLMKTPIMMGWAKPVPFNPMNFRQHPRDQVFMAAAGPLSNFAVSYLCFTLYLIVGFVFNRFFPQSPIYLHPDIFSPLTFSKVPFEAFWFVLFEMLSIGMVVNAGLGVFNLIPFPPLDGSWILKSLLSTKASVFIGKMQIPGFILLILALQFNLLQVFFYPAVFIFILFQQIANFCLR